ncbi:MAG: histidine kinase [Chloroflexus sp.]|uniref:PAS domain-containing protein n=1 Tax=Chloroflexus sp. TaxID=1904827 RepID=UPI0021DD645A|nr:PAS domain-containing protein [Chloroflexus sp.]GIV91242.1 MAG: histidine kinase [Chloroflexus sp.]
MSSPSTAEENLRAVVSHDADGAIIVDQSGAVRFLNRAAERLLNRHGAELHGQLFGLPLVVGERAEVEVLRPNGDFAVAEMRVLSIVWEGQDALLITLRDVTFERQAEAALRAAEAFSIAILNSLSSEIVVLDEHGKIVAVNDAWIALARQHGCTDVTAVGVGVEYAVACTAIGLGTAAPEVLGGLQAVLTGEQAEFTYEYADQGAQGDRWYALRAVPLRGERRGLVVALQDITAQRRAAHMAAEAALLREQLRQMERELVNVEAISRPDDLVRSRLEPLRLRAPHLFNQGLERYGVLLEEALSNRIHRTPMPSWSVRMLGEWFGSVWATPRDLIEVHLQAMRARSQYHTPKKLQAYFEEGRLILLELMGHLASYYRTLAAGDVASHDPER